MVSRRRFLVSAAVTAPSLALSAQKHKHPAPAPATETPAAPAAEPSDSNLPAPILALTDRRKDIVPITKQEREGRLDLARELLKQYKMDAIIITTGASLRYFTNAQWGQSERLFAYVIPANAAAFVVCPYFERDRLAELLLDFPERETTLSYLWQENEDPFNILQRALADNGMAAATIGIEEHTQFAFSNSIAKAAPAAKFVSATPVTAGARSIKSPAEIALLRLASAITMDVYKAVYQSCKPGDTNRHFEQLVDRAYARCGVRGDVSCNVGPFSAVPHGSRQPQVIKEGDIVLIDDGCSVDGYQSDISRTFVYGNPTDQQRSVFQLVRDAQSAALAAARPGVEAQSIDAAARKVIVDGNFGPEYRFFTHRLGHGIGLDGHEWPYLVGGNTQKLVAGMFFSNEPGIYIPSHFGVRLEDDMLITERGAELLTRQSPSLTDPFGVAAVDAAPESSAAPRPAETAAPAPSPDASTPPATPKP